MKFFIIDSVVIPGWGTFHQLIFKSSIIGWLLKKEQVVVSAIASAPHNFQVGKLYPENNVYASLGWFMSV